MNKTETSAPHAINLWDKVKQSKELLFQSFLLTKNSSIVNALDHSVSPSYIYIYISTAFSHNEEEYTQRHIIQACH